MMKANPDPDKVNYTHLVKNPKRVKVFARLDTDKMRKQIEGFREEFVCRAASFGSHHVHWRTMG